MFVNCFRTAQTQYMLFWLLKDALLGCKRCSLRPLLTPFWSPIKHLLLYTWSLIDTLLIVNLIHVCVFVVSYRYFPWNYVMIFQPLSAGFRCLKTKRFSMKEDENKINSWRLSQLYFCFMSNFGSYVKALRKASTHLTEELQKGYSTYNKSNRISFYQHKS